MFVFVLVIDSFVRLAGRNHVIVSIHEKQARNTSGVIWEMCYLSKRCIRRKPCYYGAVMQKKAAKHVLYGIGIGVLGIVVSLGVLAGLVWFATPSLESLSLAERVDITRAQSYVRSDDRRTFFLGISKVAGDVADLPALIPQGELYEFAQIDVKNGTGWIAFVWTGKDREVVGSVDEQLLLPVTERFRSLRQSAALRNFGSKRMASVVWQPTARMMLPLTSGSDILRAALAPAEEFALAWNGSESGSLVLHTEVSGRSASLAPLSLPTAPLLHLAWADPVAAFTRIGDDLAKRNPSLSEGLMNVVKAWLHSTVGDTDIAAAADTFLRGPLSIAWFRENGATEFITRGTARSNADIEKMVTLLGARSAKSTIRSLDFLNGESTRTDVMSEDNAAVLLGTESGWTLSRIGGETSKEALWTASNGRQFVLSTSQDALQNTIHASASHQASFATDMDMTWTVAQLQIQSASLGGNLSEILGFIAGKTPERLTLTSRPVAGGAFIDWELSVASPF